ncbi:MAG: hypothetical protein BWY24_00482 [Microgenomates group bacterium ADurb.Bin219]|nr:MAG: hypothetical protein BWY24_00482 [Microgenomates group bacterium ADurb.Bin219]
MIFKDFIKIGKKLVLVALGAFAAYIVFYKLGGFYLENWDEAWYGDIIRNMMRKKEFIVLYWNRSVLLDKPPFFMWVGALISSVIGLSEFSIRLPSAFSALVIITATTYYCYRSYGLVPSLLGFSSLALNNVFIWRARTGNLDALVSLEIFLIYFLILSRRKERNYLLGIMFALIYLTKASLVFFPLGIFVLHELFFRRNDLKKKKESYLLLLLIFVSISCSWLFLGSIKQGWHFAQYYLFQSDQGAANFVLSHFNFNYIRYCYYSLQRRFFWVFVMGLFFLITKIKEAKNFLMVAFSTFLLILVGFGQRDNNWYLIPSMPFWAITVACGTNKFLKIFEKRRIIKYLVVFMVLALSSYVSYKTYIVNIRSVMTSQTTANQAEVSLYLRRISKEDDLVVRLDHLYPTTIYYTDRYVYSSDKSAGTGLFFLSRQDLAEKVKKKEIKWIVGKKTEIDELTQIPPFTKGQVILTKGDESLLSLPE